MKAPREEEVEEVDVVDDTAGGNGTGCNSSLSAEQLRE